MMRIDLLKCNLIPRSSGAWCAATSIIPWRHSLELGAKRRANALADRGLLGSGRRLGGRRRIRARGVAGRHDFRAASALGGRREQRGGGQHGRRARQRLVRLARALHLLLHRVHFAHRGCVPLAAQHPGARRVRRVQRVGRRARAPSRRSRRLGAASAAILHHVEHGAQLGEPFALHRRHAADVLLCTPSNSKSVLYVVHSKSNETVFAKKCITFEFKFFN